MFCFRVQRTPATKGRALSSQPVSQQLRYTTILKIKFFAQLPDFVEHFFLLSMLWI
jgi:hypothetical protein